MKLNKNIILDVENNLYLKPLKIVDVNLNYVNWLNDYEVTKFTEQKYFIHTLKTVKEFVKEKSLSKNDILFGIFLIKNILEILN